MELEDYGYNHHFLAAFEQIDMPGLRPGRVVLSSGETHRLIAEDGEHQASVSGRLRHEAASATDLPAVGDWVAFRDSRIEAVLPRRTRLSRKGAGRRTVEQVVAADVDTVIVVMGLDEDFNPRRLDRYLTTVWQSGAVPAVLLNKADLTEAIDARRAEIEEIAIGASVLVSSCVGELDGLGLAEVRSFFGHARSRALRKPAATKTARTRPSPAARCLRRRTQVRSRRSVSKAFAHFRKSCAICASVKTPPRNTPRSGNGARSIARCGGPDVTGECEPTTSS